VTFEAQKAGPQVTSPHNQGTNSIANGRQQRDTSYTLEVVAYNLAAVFRRKRTVSFVIDTVRDKPNGSINHRELHAAWMKATEAPNIVPD